MKTTRRFDFDYKPLQPCQSLTAVSTVPDRQSFDSNTGEFTPDYTLTPLTLLASVSVIDLDGIIESGSVNKQLTNIRWSQIEAGVSTLISSTNQDYQIGAKGTDDAGQLQIRRNVDPAQPVTIVFEAEYLDPRTNQLFRILLHRLIRCTTEAASPRLEIDSPAQVVYNPVRHPAKQTVKASFTLGGADIPAANRAFIWEILRADGTWSEVGNADDGYLDYDVEISADGITATVDRSLMGDSLTLRCVALYDAGGDPASQPVTAATPVRTVSFTRRIPEYEVEILYTPYNIPKTPYIFPSCQVRDTISLLTDDEINENFLVDWLMATNKPGNATLTYQKIGEGISPQLPTDLMSATIGGVLAVDVNPRDPWMAWIDADGKALTDADGSILLIR